MFKIEKLGFHFEKFGFWDFHFGIKWNSFLKEDENSQWKRLEDGWVDLKIWMNDENDGFRWSCRKSPGWNSVLRAFWSDFDEKDWDEKWIPKDFKIWKLSLKISKDWWSLVEEKLDWVWKPPFE